jgi:hypothetical protein
MVVGNTALPLACGASAFAGGFFDGLAGWVAAVVEPHSSFRNWFQAFPLSVPADFAALYFAPHSCIVSAFTAVPPKEITAANAVAQRYIEQRAMTYPIVCILPQNQPPTII